MKVVLREDESGISEVIGTILILAMTVVLFSTIIIWVSSIPTPVSQGRLDIASQMNPMYNGAGSEIGVNVTLTHQGGEALYPVPTIIYVTSQRGSNPATTDVQRLHLFNKLLATPSGIIDGTDIVWNVGERWGYKNFTLRSTDSITITIVDTLKSVVLWSAAMSPPAGSRPPVFVDKWADRVPSTPTIDTPESGLPFYIMAQVADPDGDLNTASVYATLTYYYGQPSCAQPFRMYDDGTSGGHGDQTPNDGIFTLYVTACMSNPSLAMAGSIVLFNATDLKGHTTSTRMTLNLVQGPPGGGGGGGNGGSGRPPNLRWNGNQGYNIFNATQWDQLGYSAVDTRTFKQNETVVLVIGSLSVENVFGIDSFNLGDPFSGTPQQSVVYGATKAVTQASVPSTTQAFSFFQFVNGYYVYTYRFQLNAVSVGTNFYTTPPSYPRYYWFAKYPLSVLLSSSTGNKFATTDSINVTSDTGSLRSFPVLQTFKDTQFLQPSATFVSTDIVYVQVSMLTVDLNTSMGSVVFGNVIIQDFAGGSPLWRAPAGGTGANLPVCPIIGASCSGQAIWSVQGKNVYRFAIQLARTNQDPWVAGKQNYALSISGIRDFDETYGTVSAQLVVTAPLYKMDILAGVQEATSNAWGTKNYAFWFQNFNGFDSWKPLRVDYCSGGISTSGVSGSGSTCPSTVNVVVVYADINGDGTLDAAQSFIGTNSASPNSMFVIYRRGIDASGNIVYLPVYFDNTGSTACTALASGDVTGDGAPEIVCGASNGWIWYYKNDGSWTKVYVDQPNSGQQINRVAVADFNGDGKNDIAVGGSAGYLKWYPNLDGLGRFQNSGISDNWFAVAEQTGSGTVPSGSYLQTYVKDATYEQVQEALVNVPLYSGATVNSGFNTSAANWTNGRISGTGSQTYVSSGGNPAGYAQVVNNFVGNTVVAGYWEQSFTVTGSQPFTAFLSLDWRLISTGASSSTFYAFVDTTSAAPPQNPAAGSYVWTSGSQSSAGGWTSAVNVPITKITVPGTYYLKISMHSTYGGSGSATTGGFDNVALTWTSTPGTTSGMQQYWRLNILPNRPGTAFTFSLTGHVTASTDGDVVQLYYSTNVAGGDPATGTYTLLTTISATSDTTVSVPLTPASNFAGATVWIQAVDTNRVVGNQSLDSFFVDQMYVNANTPTGTTGITLANPNGDTSDINSISAGDQDADGFADLAVVTAHGHVFKYVGSVSGLQTPSGCYYSNAAGGSCTTSGTSIVRVKWGNMTTASAGLEIVIAFSTTVRVITGYGSTGSVITLSLPSYSPSSAITALAVGDVNGDGTDDVVIGTSGGGIFLFANLGGAVTWSNVVTVYNVGAPVYTLVIGDGSNSLYMGR